MVRINGTKIWGSEKGNGISVVLCYKGTVYMYVEGGAVVKNFKSSLVLRSCDIIN